MNTRLRKKKNLGLKTPSGNTRATDTASFSSVSSERSNFKTNLMVSTGELNKELIKKSNNISNEEMESMEEYIILLERVNRFLNDVIKETTKEKLSKIEEKDDDFYSSQEDSIIK